MTAEALARLAELNAEAATSLRQRAPAIARTLDDAAKVARCAATLEEKVEQAAAGGAKPTAAG